MIKLGEVLPVAQAELLKLAAWAVCPEKIVDLSRYHHCPSSWGQTHQPPGHKIFEFSIFSTKYICQNISWCCRF